MFKCEECCGVFDEPSHYKEYHGAYDMWPEVWAICPYCGGSNFDEYDDEEEEEEEEYEDD